MSAIVVEDKTINRLVTWLSTQGKESFYHRKLKEALDLDITLREDRKILAQSMLDTNNRAIRQRYADADETGMTVDEIEYRNTPADAIQAYKSLRCWLYQCSEGDVPETSILYSIMREISGCMAHHIVQELPGYDKAEWA